MREKAIDIIGENGGMMAQSQDDKNWMKKEFVSSRCGILTNNASEGEKKSKRKLYRSSSSIKTVDEEKIFYFQEDWNPSRI